MHQVNLSIQVIPINQLNAYSLIDEAIAIIASSGYHYEVTPFATIVEASFEELMTLIAQIKECCQENGAEELILNIQFHLIKNKDVKMSDKTKQFI